MEKNFLKSDFLSSSFVLFYLTNNIRRILIYPEYIPFEQHPFLGENKNGYKSTGQLDSYAGTVLNFPENLFLTASASGLPPLPLVGSFSCLLYFVRHYMPFVAFVSLPVPYTLQSCSEMPRPAGADLHTNNTALAWGSGRRRC